MIFLKLLIYYAAGWETQICHHLTLVLLPSLRPNGCCIMNYCPYKPSIWRHNGHWLRVSILAKFHVEATFKPHPVYLTLCSYVQLLVCMCVFFLCMAIFTSITIFMISCIVCVSVCVSMRHTKLLVFDIVSRPLLGKWLVLCHCQTTNFYCVPHFPSNIGHLINAKKYCHYILHWKCMSCQKKQHKEVMNICMIVHAL